MKRIKSAPANICEMVNRKKLNNLNIGFGLRYNF